MPSINGMDFPCLTPHRQLKSHRPGSLTVRVECYIMFHFLVLVFAFVCAALLGEYSAGLPTACLVLVYTSTYAPTKNKVLAPDP